MNGFLIENKKDTEICILTAVEFKGPCGSSPETALGDTLL